MPPKSTCTFLQYLDLAWDQDAHPSFLRGKVQVQTFSLIANHSLLKRLKEGWQIKIQGPVLQLLPGLNWYFSSHPSTTHSRFPSPLANTWVGLGYMSAGVTQTSNPEGAESLAALYLTGLTSCCCPFVMIDHPCVLLCIFLSMKMQSMS